MSVRNADGRLIATHSGLRGRPGAGLDGAVVRKLVGEFLSLLAERGLPRTVGLARDARPSGERLAAQAIEEARRQGADIVDFGVVSTPTAKRAARSSGLGGGIIVTGSHLGPDWNGIKLVAAPDYWPIDTSRLPATSTAPEGPTGALHRDRTADEVHAAAVCDAVDADAIRRANLRVSLSGGCGRAAHLALERLGCSLVEDEADLGLVIDGDGDRLQLVDERSNRLDTEVTFPLAAISLGAHRLVKGADTSRIAEHLAEERGWSIRLTSPGELHLLEELDDWDADAAGEGNGGVVVPQVGAARDALAAAASIISLVASSGESLSELASELPRLARRRTSLPCSGEETAREALEFLAEQLGMELEDPHVGLMLERPGEGWALVRQSATEPVLRITVESSEQEQADLIFEELRAALPMDA
jgi:phosphomannomutase